MLAVVVALALTVVIVAPIALSSQDLVRWAADPAGLGLAPAWAWLAFVALDAAAAVCVGMVTIAAWRGEPGGTFHTLTWMFAAGSAVANYRHGISTPARDDEYFFPAMSLAGPLLLDVTLARIRRWVRIEARTQLAARPKFGARWLPGVAFGETFAAWRAAIREDIARPDQAVAHVREVRALAGMTPTDALHLAYQALGPDADIYTARQWLTARGVTITQDIIDAVTAPTPAAHQSAPSVPARDTTDPGQEPSEPDQDGDAVTVTVVDVRDVPASDVHDDAQTIAEPAAPLGGQARAPRPPRAAPAAADRGADRSTTSGDRLKDAIELVRANPQITAPQLAVQLAPLGWNVSDRTATRILSHARRAGRLSAVR